MKYSSLNPFRFFLIFTVLLIAYSCKKDKVFNDNDPRMQYVGKWNFKGNSYYFSGFYDYSTEVPQWTYISSSSTSYNDSTGSIQLGSNNNELIIKYCSTCEPVVYKMGENGKSSWTLSVTDFFNDITPEPPGYVSTYSTYNIQGWRLND